MDRILEYQKTKNQELLEELLDQWTPLIYRLSRGYLRSDKFKAFTREIIEEARIGLVFAIDKYSKKRGAFHTFATYEVKGKIKSVVEQVQKDERSLNAVKNLAKEKEGLAENIEKIDIIEKIIKQVKQIIKDPKNLFIIQRILMGWNEPEIGRLLGIRKQAVNKRKLDIFKKIKKDPTIQKLWSEILR